jgi:osmotically-inducible protein OsmY
MHMQLSASVEGFDSTQMERVVLALHASGYSDLRGIEITVRDRAVVLTGRVRSFHMKQMAQTIARPVTGILALCNELEVIRI